MRQDLQAPQLQPEMSGVIAYAVVELLPHARLTECPWCDRHGIKSEECQAQQLQSEMKWGMLWSSWDLWLLLCSGCFRLGLQRTGSEVVILPELQGSPENCQCPKL